MMRNRCTKHDSSGIQNHGKSKYLRMKNLKCYHCDERGHAMKCY